MNDENRKMYLGAGLGSVNHTSDNPLDGGLSSSEFSDLSDSSDFLTQDGKSNFLTSVIIYWILYGNYKYP